MHIIRRVAAVSSGAALLLLAFAAPAHAHDVRLGGPNGCGVTGLQSCGYVQVRSNHTIVDACDTIADGNGYAAGYKLRNGTQGVVSDGNGSAAGCGIKQVGTASNPVTHLQPCYRYGTPLICSPYTAV